MLINFIDLSNSYYVNLLKSHLLYFFLNFLKVSLNQNKCIKILKILKFRLKLINYLKLK